MKFISHSLLVYLLTLLFLFNCKTATDGSLAVDTSMAPPSADAWTLTIAHINDSHSHFEPSEVAVKLDVGTTYLEVGGFARITTAVNAIRQANQATLLLHAGDALQGTIYFMKFEGRAELEILNLLQLDAMVAGNHEFDKGPALLAAFISDAMFPLVGANIDTSRENLLHNKIKPYIIKEIDGKRVGIIGLVTDETPRISFPGPNLGFLDPIVTAKSSVAELVKQGITKIIVLSHLGINVDSQLAKEVADIDIIVGGHSHTLLGDLSPLGLNALGPYPIVEKSPKGETVLIVQAWDHARSVGQLNVTFDPQGVIASYDGHPILPCSETFTQKDASGAKVKVDEDTSAAIKKELATSGVLKITAADPKVSAKITAYKNQLSSMVAEKVGSAKTDLNHVQVPGEKHNTAGTMPAGSAIAPHFVDAMLWKANKTGLKAQVALQNAGGIRTDIPKGDITVGGVYELLPFGNTLFAIDLTGSELRMTLEEAITRAVITGEGKGAFPYVAGAKYTFDAQKPTGKRLVDLQIKSERSWRKVADQTVYRVVTNSFVAGGGDNYQGLAKTTAYRYDSGFTDAELFIDYLKEKGELDLPEELRTVLKLNQ